MTTTSNLSVQTVKYEFIANSSTGGPQMLPQVLALSNGGYAIAYNNQSSADGFILVDFYDANSNRTHDTARVAANSLAHTSATGNPSLAQLKDGTVVVAWTDSDPANLGIRVAQFTQTGEKIGTDKMLVPGQFSDLHIEAVQYGGFELSYSSQNHIHSAYYGDWLWSPSPNIDQIAGNAVTDPTSVMLSNGKAIVTWSSDNGSGNPQLHGRIYSNDGLPIGSEMILDATGINLQSSLAALPNGYFAMAYTDTSWASEGGSTGISLNIMTPHLTSALLGGAIHVNAANPLADSLPSVTVLENGFILVTWNKEVTPGSYDVYGRVFTQSGTSVALGGSTGEFLISSAPGNDTFPAVTALGSGKFLTAWTSNNSGTQDIAATVKEIIRYTGGDSADDSFNGDILRDVVFSGFGNDTVDGRGGDDFIDGGAGDDTAVFSQSIGNYVVQDLGSKITVTGPDGNDTLVNVEHLRFADGTLHVVDDGNPLFDTLYYLSRNPDVFHAGVNALDHFNTQGWHEGRDPSAFFDTSGYLAVNKDVAQAGANPLDHYHQSGWHEGRDPSADFDTSLYLIHNPDVAAAGIDPLAHFLQFGMAEGRQAYAAVGQNIAGGFDAQYYLFHNPDVAAAGVDALAHFNQFGWHEGRNPNGWFDTAGYLSHYADIAAAGVNPLQHYEQYGWQEGRDPSAGFDTLGYLAANPDVAAAGVNPLDHFLSFGIYEGRAAINDGLWH